jgi:hypothetical protein
VKSCFGFCNFCVWCIQVENWNKLKSRIKGRDALIFCER